jgi:hypothetical protein
MTNGVFLVMIAPTYPVVEIDYKDSIVYTVERSSLGLGINAFTFGHNYGEISYWIFDGERTVLRLKEYEIKWEQAMVELDMISILSHIDF